MSNVNTLKTIPTKSDEWNVALDDFGKKHEIFRTNRMQPIDELISPAMNEKIKYYSEIITNTPNYTQRDVVCLNKHDEVVCVFYDTDLVDGKLCIQKHYPRHHTGHGHG